MPPPSSQHSLSDGRGEAPIPSRSPFPYPPNRLLAFLLASLSAGRLDASLSPFPYTAVGEDACFSRAYPFSLSIPPWDCDTLTYRYTCGRGGTADTPDLGSGGEIRVGSNPTARTNGDAQPAPAARSDSRGAGFFHAAETKIQSILSWHGRNGRAAS